MMRKSFLLASVLSAWTNAAIASDSSVQAFFGEWKGEQVSSAAENLSPDKLDIRVRSDEQGFHISWQDLGGSVDGSKDIEDLDAYFAPAGRPGVYEFSEQSDSLLTRMFASPSSGNPLEGETLLWARVDDATLAIYSMEVEAKGGFLLDHYSWTRTDKGLRLVFSRRSEDLGEGQRIEGDLVAKGG